MCLFAHIKHTHTVLLTHVYTVHDHGSDTGCKNILDDSQPLPPVVLSLLLLLIILGLRAQKLLHLRKKGGGGEVKQLFDESEGGGILSHHVGGVCYLSPET